MYFPSVGMYFPNAEIYFHEMYCTVRYQRWNAPSLNLLYLPVMNYLGMYFISAGMYSLIHLNDDKGSKATWPLKRRMNLIEKETEYKSTVLCKIPSVSHMLVLMLTCDSAGLCKN